MLNTEVFLLNCVLCQFDIAPCFCLPKIKIMSRMVMDKNIKSFSESSNEFITCQYIHI